MKYVNDDHSKKYGYYVFNMAGISNSNTVNVTTRETYSLFDLFGDIGGLYEFFLITGGLVVQHFSHMKLNSLLANRLYYWPKSEEFDADEFSKPKEE